MTETVNKTYDNTDSSFTYTPGPSPTIQCWAQLSSASGYFNNTDAVTVQSGCNSSFTFVFPEPAVAFYYYGGFALPNEHFIWVDSNPSTDNPEIAQFTGNNTEAGQISALLYVKRFEQPGLHNIIIGGPNPSLLSVDSVVLEVPSANGSAPITASSNAVSSTSTTTSGGAISTHPASTSTPNLNLGRKKVPYGAVVGGIIGGAALLLVILAMWLQQRRKRNTPSLHANGRTPFVAVMSQARSTKAPTRNISTITRIPAVFSKRSNVVHNPQGQSGSLETPGDSRQLQNSNIGDTRRREVDGGPVENEDSEAAQTLPPDYDQVFRIPTAPSVRPLENVKHVNLRV